MTTVSAPSAMASVSRRFSEDAVMEVIGPSTVRIAAWLALRTAGIACSRDMAGTEPRIASRRMASARGMDPF